MPQIGLGLIAAAEASSLGLGWMRLEAAKPFSTQHPTPAIPVQTAVVAPQSVEFTRTGLGTVVAWNKATITPQVSGQLVEIPFQEGSLVRQGDILVRIDPRPFQAALDQVKAKKAQDEANLVAVEKNLSRDEILMTKGGFATQQTVDNERAQVDADKATIVGDDAALETAQLNLDYATIKAPFTGVVGLRNVDVGNVVTSASNIATITEIEPISVDFTVPQADLSLVQAAAAQGKPSVLALDQNGTASLGRGTLEAIDDEVDPTSGTIKLKARFDNKDHKLWPGDFVQVRLVVRTEPNAIAIPSEAVQRGPDGPYVWLVSPDQTARRQQIEMGEIQDNRTVIVGGLAAGDHIVVAGQYRLAQGARVTEAAAAVAQAQGSRS